MRYKRILNGVRMCNCCKGGGFVIILVFNLQANDFYHINWINANVYASCRFSESLSYEHIYVWRTGTCNYIFLPSISCVPCTSYRFTLLNVNNLWSDENGDPRIVLIYSTTVWITCIINWCVGVLYSMCLPHDDHATFCYIVLCIVHQTDSLN